MRVSSRIVAYGSGNRGAAAAGGTPYDIGTASTPILSKSITATDVFEGITWGDSGSKMYVAHLDGDIKQYTVSTPYDITTLIDTPTTFNVSAQEISTQCVEFSIDGTKMYIAGNDTHISQYTLSTPWNLGGTVTYFGDGTVDYNGWSTGGIHFNSTGTRVYMVFHNIGTTCYLYGQNIGTPWNITTIQAGGTFTNISTDTGQGTGIHISDDGTLLHVSSNDTGSDHVIQYTLGTPFDESSAILDTTYDSSALDASVSDITWNADGTIMYLLGDATNTIYQVPLTG